ncbi:MAG: hypothetical protein GY802_01130 [Gammaproteobacteria bacterium]|nr:hypothetical protein [Gammaproteobacteria bacterium]
MSASADLDRLFRAFKRYKDALIAAHLRHNGFVDDTELGERGLRELADLGLLWQAEEDGRYRLSQSVIDLFNVARRDEIRRNVSVDLADRLKSLEESVASYRVARREASEAEEQQFLLRVEEQVYALREILAAASRQLWQEINSEFGYVTTIELKLQENRRVIDRARRLNDNLALVGYEILSSERFAGDNPQLRRLFLGSLTQALTAIRHELVDALYRLEQMLFTFREQQYRTRLVCAFHQRFQRDPGFSPTNYAEFAQIPELLNQVVSLGLSGHADLDETRHEAPLSHLIAGLRKRETAVVTEEAEPIAVSHSDGAIAVDIPRDPLREAVRGFYLSVGPGDSIRAMVSRHLAPADCDADTWVQAIISRHNLMTARERRVFDLEFVQTYDRLFDGRFVVTDVRVERRRA